MKIRISRLVGTFAGCFVAIACGNKQGESRPAVPVHQEQSVEQTQRQTADTKTTDQKYQKGDAVPKERVCMVNDAYMGTAQLLVAHEGKDYYGCCETYKARILEDQTVRVATDPHSLKQVDKADAFIVLIGNKGEVAYFESAANYTKMVEENTL